MAPKSIDLDLRGLKCPMPVLRTRRALSRLAAGDRVTVLCTDPLAGIDIPHFLRTAGHELESQTTVDGVVAFVIVKARRTQRSRPRMPRPGRSVRPPL
jgi:Predicted redox protein, regulator of disulfide bond formation